MKKNILIPIILSLILIPFLTFGNVISYKREPEGYKITSPVKISVSFDSYRNLCADFYSSSPLYTEKWRLAIYDLNYQNEYFSNEEYPLNTLSGDFTFDLPSGKYVDILTQCWYPGNGSSAGFYDRHDSDPSMEYNNDNPIFEITTPTGNFISLPSDTIQQIKNEFNEVFQDLKPVLPFIIGIWLGFWVIENVIAYFSVKREKW
jgi:hypothetical protein